LPHYFTTVTFLTYWKNKGYSHKMASKQRTIDFIIEQISQAGVVSARKMFGEYALYCDGKVVALVCDDQLFVKPTAAGKVFLGNPIEGIPYPGAKPSWHISGDLWEDAEWLTDLIRITAAELPLLKKKERKAKRQEKL
jgi:TfoX/Sxy family transcriptional regulator of competence genes